MCVMNIRSRMGVLSELLTGLLEERVTLDLNDLLDGPKDHVLKIVCQCLNFSLRCEG